MYKVMIIDDEPIIAEGLSKIIPWSQWNAEVVAVAPDGLNGQTEKPPLWVRKKTARNMRL